MPYYGCDYSETGVPPSPPGCAGEVWLPGYLCPSGPHTTTTHHPPDYDPPGGDGGHTPRVREFPETEVPYGNHDSATRCDKSDAYFSPVNSSPREINDWEFLSNSPSPPPFANLKVGGTGSSPPQHKGFEGDCLSDANDNHGLAASLQPPSILNGCIPGSLQQPLQTVPVAAGNCGQSVATGGTYDPKLNGMYFIVFICFGF